MKKLPTQTEEAPDRHKKLTTDRTSSRQKKLPIDADGRSSRQTEEAPDRQKKLTTDRRSSRQTEFNKLPTDRSSC